MVRMDLFRSEEMSKVQLIMPAESAHDTITYLAEIGHLMFKDVRQNLTQLHQEFNLISWPNLAFWSHSGVFLLKEQKF
jgi:hypothetical protein